MTAARTLAEHVTSRGPGALPAEHVAQQQRLLLDYLGVALAGSRTDSGRIAADFVLSLGGAEQASVLGRAGRVPAVHAAFANAVAEHSVELDDVDEEALFHYGPPVVSTALAVAQQRGASGAALLTAMLAGCEVMARLSRATNPALRDRGFHTTPTCGTFGAAAAAGVLLGLDAERMTSAFGLAGAQASGLMEMYGPSMQKRINPGPAARAGVTAASLAALGYTGADTVFEGERGFGAAFSGSLDLVELLGDLGTRIPVVVEHKAHSAARPIHNAIDAALRLRPALVERLDAIASVVVHRHPDWADYHRNPAPRTFHEAQVSLPYSVAVALTHGAAMPEQYADDLVRDPGLQRLSGSVVVEHDPGLPRGVSCRLVVALEDGTTLVEQVDDPKGSLGNPMSREELVAKFRTLSGLPQDLADDVVRRVDGLERLASVEELLQPLAQDPS